MKKTMCCAVLLFGGFALSSCVSGSPPPSALTKMHWQWNQVQKGRQAPRQTTLSGVPLNRYRLDIKNGMLSLSGGCNGYSATLHQLGDNGLSVGLLAGTLKGCEQKSLEKADSEVAGLLSSVSAFRLEQNQLVLSGGGNTLTFRGTPTDENRYGQVAQTQFIELRTPPSGLVWRKATYDSDWIQNNKNAPWSSAPFPGIRDFMPENNRHYIVRVNTFKDPQAGREIWVKDMVVTQGEL